jgi:hypothetical protein
MNPFFFPETALTFPASCRALYPGDIARWSNTPVPSLGIIVKFDGMASSILLSGLLAVTLDNIVYSPRSERPPRPPSAVRNLARLRLKKGRVLSKKDA